MNETRTDDVAAPSAPAAGTALSSADRTVRSRVPPPHAVEAAATYLAELDDLLAHLLAHPNERWVAYRGRERLGFGTSQRMLYLECVQRFPDQQVCVYGIDACAKCPDDTEILSPPPTEWVEVL
ncbi:hypothetical protein [Frigoriglobus tundricola]|uniref:hypothetical protein n=1 Tax=Frigoriglobus tundricola TaxID=2774151 RepID=UPI00148EE80D|nr:hypothetical protein [Frigoriglobus tundricola]